MTENKKPSPVMVYGVERCATSCPLLEGDTCTGTGYLVTDGHNDLCEPAILARLKELEDDNTVLKHNNSELRQRIEDRRNIFFNLAYASHARIRQSEIKRLTARLEELEEQAAEGAKYTAWLEHHHPADSVEAYGGPCGYCEWAHFEGHSIRGKDRHNALYALWEGMQNDEV